LKDHSNQTAKQITASMLYDLVICPNRPSMDLFGDPQKRDAISPFVRLLWERGTAYEKEVVSKLEDPFLDLSGFTEEEKEKRTTEAMKAQVSLIYSGRISAGDLLGEPDLLSFDSSGYVAGDIKSGSAEEGPEDHSRPKKHYAVQLALYTDILERKGLSSERTPYIIDIQGHQVSYQLDQALGKRDCRTYWDFYQEVLEQAKEIITLKQTPLPAYSAACKLCHWYSACLEQLQNQDDLTLIPELGRSKRDSLVDTIPTVAAMATSDVEPFIEGKKTQFPGIGPDSLRKFQVRAALNKEESPKPFLKTALNLPQSENELFFDIEVNPMSDFCYLHGFIQRKNHDNQTEKYYGFFSEEISEAGEEQCFAEAYSFILQQQPCAIYYYSKYERTIWRSLQKKYPQVCDAEDIEALFQNPFTIDLYEVVRRSTEWPTRDYSIKTLAKYLGFQWRDTNPSGAASIEWFDRWEKSRDAQTKNRILDYNEDDCIATRILLDGLKNLEMK